MLPEVDAVVWEAPDAHRFKEHYRGTVGPMLHTLQMSLSHINGDLMKQAADQDQCSSGAGAAGGAAGGAGHGAGEPEHGILYNMWKDFKKYLNWVKMPPFLTELAVALRNPSVLGPIFTRSWEGLTGFRPGTGSAKGIEKLAEELKVGKFNVGGIYKFFKDVGDGLQLKPLSLPLEKAATNFIDQVTHRDPHIWVEAQKAGAGLFDKVKYGVRDASMDDLLRWTGKEGRVAAKGLGLVGIGVDAFDMATHINSGNAQGAIYSGVKVAPGAIAVVASGPVGWIAGGTSLALAAYDTIGPVHRTVDNVVGGVKDYVSKLFPF